jgi:hypothetical protein
MPPEWFPTSSTSPLAGIRSSPLISGRNEAAISDQVNGGERPMYSGLGSRSASGIARLAARVPPAPRRSVRTGSRRFGRSRLHRSGL